MSQSRRSTRPTKNDRPVKPETAAKRVAREYRERRDPPLMLYWLIGHASQRLDTRHGTAAIVRFTLELQGLLPGRGVNRTSVYRARQFVRTVSSRQLKRLIRHGVTWSSLTPLLALSHAPKVQQDLLDRLASGDPLTARDVRWEVRRVVDGDARLGRNPTGGARGIESHLRQAREALKHLDARLAHHKTMSPAAVARLADHLQQLRDQARRVHARVRRATS